MQQDDPDRRTGDAFMDLLNLRRPEDTQEPGVAARREKLAKHRGKAGSVATEITYFSSVRRGASPTTKKTIGRPTTTASTAMILVACAENSMATPTARRRSRFLRRHLDGVRLHHARTKYRVAQTERA
ncbi:hypothetical protein [Antarctobacter heliothermus]|uniref:hypothetical protein n=1 Tax=Antarctobacter heliothermus TaxID=74033 RepID=UPI0011319821|nr:hypothetical protein [Antarctobacter heliothermus]